MPAPTITLKDIVQEQDSSGRQLGWRVTLIVAEEGEIAHEYSTWFRGEMDNPSHYEACARAALHRLSLALTRPSDAVESAQGYMLDRGPMDARKQSWG